MEYTTIHGWPQYKKDVQLAARDFFIVRGELSLHDGLSVRGDRIVVPFCLRKQILERIPEGQTGVAKCRERAAQSVWWPRTGKRHQITGRQLPTLPGEAAISGQGTPPTIDQHDHRHMAFSITISTQLRLGIALWRPAGV